MSPRAHAIAGVLQGALLYCAWILLYRQLDSWGGGLVGFAVAIAAFSGVCVLLLAAWLVLAIARRRANTGSKMAATGIWLAAVVAGLVVCGVGWVVAGRYARSQAVAAMAGAGYRLELPAPAAAVRDEDNIAEWLKEASAASSERLEHVPALPLGLEPPPPADVELARRLLDEHRRALELLQRAAQARATDWKIDWSRSRPAIGGPSNARGSAISGLPNLSRLAAWKAILLAQEGKSTDAEALIGDLLTVADAVGAPPLLDSQIATLTIADHALDGARHVLGQREVSGAGLARQLDEAKFLERFRRSAILELAAFPQRPTQAAGPAKNFFVPVDLDVAAHQRLALYVLHTLHTPPAHLQAWTRFTDDAIARRGWPLTHAAYRTVPALDFYPLALEVTAKQRLAVAAVSARDHRRRLGRWPEAPVGTDPFTGGPFRARREGDTLVMWSVGPDFRDDGGLARHPDDARGDVVWLVR